MLDTVTGQRKVTGYISVRNECGPAIDLLENMDASIFNEELLQCSAATGLFKYRSIGGSATSRTGQPSDALLACSWIKANQRWNCDLEDAGTTRVTIDHSNKIKTPFLGTKYMTAGRRNTRRNGARLLSVKLQTVINNRHVFNGREAQWVPSLEKQQLFPFWWKEFSSSHLGTGPWWSWERHRKEKWWGCKPKYT